MMINNIFFNKSNGIKIMHIILFIITGMYILESIFIRGQFKIYGIFSFKLYKAHS